MSSKRQLLKKSRIYIIIDKETMHKTSAADIALKITNSIPCIIQLRDKISNIGIVLKDALGLGSLLKKMQTPFIVNDYIDVAKIADIDGIHLGQDDLPIKIARRILGSEKIIGISCHNLNDAIKAEKAGADYIGIGPIFPTSTKPGYKAIGPDVLSELRKHINIPFFAIGGINTNNVNTIVSYGVKQIAVCRAICQSKSIKKTIRRFKQILL